MTELKVSNSEELNALFEATAAAQAAFATFTQEQVDKIFKAASLAACKERLVLAQEAVAETGIGVVEDKVIKNSFSSEYIYNKFAKEKTCGVIEEDLEGGFARVAEPLGILAALTPTTNPTSTAIFKILIALKTRNCILLSPHPRAAQCTMHAARICYQAAVKAGAPDHCVGWISHPTIALAGELMKHPKVSAILATGGAGMVHAAYSSGNPAIGVGPGNTPCVIDELANVDTSVSQVILSKSFDNGVVCASEQVVIAHERVYKQVVQTFTRRGARVLTPEEKDKVTDVLFRPAKDGHRMLNAAHVGLDPEKLLAAAGIEVPEGPKPRLLVAPCSTHVDEIWCHEKLMPCVAVLSAPSWEACVQTAVEILRLGGEGHTAVLHTGADADNPRAESYRRVSQFQLRVPANRVVINSPASHGALGDLWNFRQDPSLTLGCGAAGKNSISENVAPRHLLNIKTVALKRENMLWFRVPPRIFFKRGCLSVALRELAGRKRAFVVTDPVLFDLGMSKRVTDALEAMGVVCSVFSDVQPDPTLRLARRCAAEMGAFRPDLVVALGGGSAIDLMKVARLLYEYPDEPFEDMCVRFMDILKRIHKFPELLDSAKSIAVCIPTTSGTGAEVTPFAVITDSDAGVKYPLADYQLVPHMAIIDADLVLTMPAALAAFTGLDALTHALESYVSVMASPFTRPLSLQAIKSIFTWLEKSVVHGDAKAREEVHHAAAIAGMAFGNAFLGVNHSLAHKMGQKFHIPHGLANAQVMTHVIRYNATDSPFRQGAFPQYETPDSIARYAEVARYCGLGSPGASDAALVEALIEHIDDLMRRVRVSKYVCDSRNPPSRDEWMSAAHELAVYAFDDQCTAANPRYPLIAELEEILRAVYSPEDDDYHTAHAIQ